MVFFLCSVCGESVKKAKVAVHRCGGAQWSCMDCGKIFPGMSYNKHTSCISEAEKYQGHLYQGNRQSKETVAQIWLRSCGEAASKVESDASVPPEHRTVITTICALENIPRKKKKFDNFMQNQGQHISTTAAQAAWDYISGIFTANKAISDKQQQQQSSKKAAKASSKSAASDAADSDSSGWSSSDDSGDESSANKKKAAPQKRKASAVSSTTTPGADDSTVKKARVKGGEQLEFYNALKKAKAQKELKLQNSEQVKEKEEKKDKKKKEKKDKKKKEKKAKKESSKSEKKKKKKKQKKKSKAE